MLHVNMTFALSFPFHELHVRSMQIYEKLILHLQIKIDGRTTSRSFFKYKFSKQTNLFCLKNNFIVTSRKQSCLQATQKLDRFFEARIFSHPSPTPDSIPSSSRQNLVEDLPLLRNLLTHISTWPATIRFLSRSKRENHGKEVVIALEHQDGGRDVISNASFLPSFCMVVFKISTAMHSNKMSEMNSLESRDSKQKCRGWIKGFFTWVTKTQQ